MASPGFDTFVPIVSTAIGGFATWLYGTFSNRRADHGVRRQIHAYARPLYQDLCFLWESMNVVSRTSLPVAIDGFLSRAYDHDVAVALTQRQSEALYEAANWLVGLKSWISLDPTAHMQMQHLPNAARIAVECSTCSIARLLITLDDDLSVQSMTPPELHVTKNWTTHVLEASVIDRARVLIALANWGARKNLWKSFGTDQVKIEKLRKLFGAKWPNPATEADSAKANAGESIP